MNRFYGKMLGKTIRRVSDVDLDTNDTGWGFHLRIKVDIKLFKPLARDRKFLVDNKELWSLDPSQV